MPDNHLIEKLTAKDTAEKWIHDFVHSDDPKFSGKSKEERRKMALGAYYNKLRESEEGQFLLEYQIQQTPYGIKVVHNGKVVYTATDIQDAQRWISTKNKPKKQADVNPLKQFESEEKIKMLDNLLESCFVSNYVQAEQIFKEIMAEKVQDFMTVVRQEAAKDMMGINESMRLMKTHTSDDGRHVAKVYKDSEYGEHRVRFFTDGKHHEDVDYHTDDHKDANDTAKAELKRMQGK